MLHVADVQANAVSRYRAVKRRKTMEEVDLEAQLLLEEGGARRNIPHQQDRHHLPQEVLARRSAWRLGCSGRCRFQLSPSLISGFHRDDLLRRSESELQCQHFAVRQELIAFELANPPACG